MASVCFQCFSDLAIVEYIQRNGKMVSKCRSCGQTNCLAIPAKEVSPLLEPLLDSLELYEYGSTLEEILTNEVAIISSNCTDADRLISDILGDSYPDTRYRFKDLGDQEDEWDKFKEELIFSNRYFPQRALSSSIFSISGKSDDALLFVSFISTLIKIIEVDESFHRARISGAKLSASEMGRPPKEKASSGRANPSGIAYLYIAGSVETAIKEVRPHTGSHVYVSEVVATKTLRILDLTEPKKHASVLKFNEDDYGKIVKFLKILELFSEDLSKPVLPEKSHLEYVPTQYFCEYVKTLKRIESGHEPERIFDGIQFQSSLSADSNNLVLFDDSKVTINSPVEYYIRSNKLDFEMI